jgi:hypothetical protein
MRIIIHLWDAPAYYPEKSVVIHWKIPWTSKPQKTRNNSVHNTNLGQNSKKTDEVHIYTLIQLPQSIPSQCNTLEKLVLINFYIKKVADKLLK